MTDNIELKDKIIKKATELFGKYGYTTIKTDQLAKELGISKRTLYLHFSSKKELLNTVIDDILEKTQNNMKEFFLRIESGKDNFVEELMKFWDVNIKITSVLNNHFFMDIKNNMPETMERFNECRQKNMRENFDKLYSIGLKQGVFKKEVRKDVLYLVHFFSMNNILNPDVLADSSFSIREAIEQIYMIIMTGAMTDKGCRRLYDEYNTLNKNQQNLTEMNLININKIGE